MLEALPRARLARFARSLEQVELRFGEELYVAGRRSRHAWFPLDGLISLISTVDHHQGLEVGLVGREGVLGVSLFLGATSSPVSATVQGSGTALRATVAVFDEEIRSNAQLRTGLAGYTHGLMSQITRIVGCNRFHRIDARLARWLLMTEDRLGVPRFLMTQEFLSKMLGVRRSGVSEAASELQVRGLIGYTRGVIEILDRRGLEAASCSCYRALDGTSP